MIYDEDVAEAVEEVLTDWREKVSAKRRAKMEKEFSEMDTKRIKRLEKLSSEKGLIRLGPEELKSSLSRRDSRKYFGSDFDADQFRVDVSGGKPCDTEALQIAEYYLFRVIFGYLINI